MADPVALLGSSDTKPSSLKYAEEEVRAGFVRKVYGILSVQLLLTVAIAVPFQFMAPLQLKACSWMLGVSMVALVASMCTMLCCADKLRSFPSNYIFLLVLTGCMGVLVGFSSAMYTWQSVVLAAGITVGVFFGMTIYAWTTKTDFTGCGPYVLASLMVLCGFACALSLLSFLGFQIKGMIMLYDFLGVLLFTFYIVYDTQLIMGGDHKVRFEIDDYAFAALNLYLDIINLFLQLLELLGDRK